MKISHYGLYLIPPPRLLLPLAQLHQTLRTEYHCSVAQKFMAHCTVKGFTRLKPDANVADFLPQLDQLMQTTPGFSTHIFTLNRHNNGEKGTSLLFGLECSEVFRAFHTRVVEIIQPYIAPDCPFSHVEGVGPNFWPHFTVCQYDAPADPELFEQVRTLSQFVWDSSLSGSFQAETIQLIEFTSDDWDGSWWQTLDWQQIKGWKLK